MVASEITLHIGSLWHVTVYTLSPLTVELVMRMGGWINFWAVGIGARVAAHAKRISRLQYLSGMRLVAVHAAHAGMVHFAAEKRGEDIVFLPHLAIRIIDF